VDPRQQLKESIEKAISVPELAKAKVSIHVIRLRDGETVYTRNAQESLVVASNNKLAVTAAALEVLGEDYGFETLVWTRGQVAKDGTLKGDVIVRGGGDPNLSGRFHERPTSIFEGWAKELKEKGVRRIEGDIVADDHLFDREWVSPHWPKNQLTSWYCAPASALSFNDNCIDLTVRPGKATNSPLVVTLSPPTSYVALRVTAKTGTAKSRSAVWFQRRSGSNTITVGGRHPLGGAPYSDSVTIHDPARFAAHVFREAIIGQGIEVTGQAKVWHGTSPDPGDGGRRIALHTSPLLPTLCVMNKRSQNFYAEQVLKTLGLFTRQKGTRENGLAAVAEFLGKVGIGDGEYEMVDGCGLAKRNRFSAAQIARLLAWMHDTKHREAFRSTLAVAGEDGTLARRFRGTKLGGRVFAKTGYVLGASALSGYLRSKAGQDYAFSILMNRFSGSNYQMKQIQESICTAIDGLPGAEAKSGGEPPDTTKEQP